jgi:hypothetical protein
MQLFELLDSRSVFCYRFNQLKILQALKPQWLEQEDVRFCFLLYHQTTLSTGPARDTDFHAQVLCLTRRE